MASIGQLFYKTDTGLKISIATAQPGDAEALIRFINLVAGQSNFLTMGQGEFLKTIDEEEDFIKVHLAQENRLSILAKDQGRIISHLNVHASPKPRLRHIGEFGLTVDKKYWGHGIGSKMMETMITWAKESNIIRKLNLRVVESNKRAIALYQKFGFEVEGRVTRDLYLDELYLDSFLIGLQID